MRMDWDRCDISLMNFSRWLQELAVQIEVEDRALVWLGSQPDATAVTLDDFLDKGQSDAGAGLLPIGRVLQSLENAEDFFVEFGCDTNAIVPDIEHVVLKSRTRVDRGQKSNFHKAFCLVVVLDRIGNEIAEYLGNACRVADKAWQRAGYDDARASLLENVFHHQPNLGDDRVGVGLL